jgi:hypothetical protein
VHATLRTPAWVREVQHPPPFRGTDSCPSPSPSPPKLFDSASRDMVLTLWPPKLCLNCLLTWKASQDVTRQLSFVESWHWCGCTLVIPALTALWRRSRTGKCNPTNNHDMKDNALDLSPVSFCKEKATESLLSLVAWLVVMYSVQLFPPQRFKPLVRDGDHHCTSKGRWRSASPTWGEERVRIGSCSLEPVFGGRRPSAPLVKGLLVVVTQPHNLSVHILPQVGGVVLLSLHCIIPSFPCKYCISRFPVRPTRAATCLTAP